MFATSWFALPWLALAGCRVSGSATPEAAHRRLQAAIASGDDLGAIRACEDYLTWVRGPDLDTVRTRQVRTAYKHAFVRWVAGLPAVPDSEAAKRIERFGKLVSGSNKGAAGK